MRTLRSALNELASNFASSVLDAIRTVSLDELVSEGGSAGPARRGPGRPRGSGSVAPVERVAATEADAGRPACAPLARADREGRRAVVALVKKSQGWAALRTDPHRAQARQEGAAEGARRRADEEGAQEQGPEAGNALLSRVKARATTEAAVCPIALGRMLEVGRPPDSVCVRECSA
jgi:hypothetical protein